MDIFLWVLQESESALAVARTRSSNTEILLVYALLSLFIKKPHLLTAFFMSCLLFEWSLFDAMTEAQLYLVTFLIYSYVMPCNVFSIKTQVACAIMCFLCLLFAYDAAFYGVDGFYGERETFVYNNIEHFFICSHCLIVCSFIDIERIRNNLRSFIDGIRSMSANSVYFVVM